MVGAARFELATSCSQSRRSTRLSYTPNCRRRVTHTRGLCQLLPSLQTASVQAAVNNLFLRRWAFLLGLAIYLFFHGYHFLS